MRYLKCIVIPAQQQDLESQARENGAQKNILEAQEDLPDVTYDRSAEVMKPLETKSAEKKRAGNTRGDANRFCWTTAT
jgi:Protein of unknown function (DUF2795)